MIKTLKENKLISVLVVAIILSLALFIHLTNEPKVIELSHAEQQDFTRMDYYVHSDFAELAEDSNAIVVGRVLDVERKTLDVGDYQEALMDFLVYSIEVQESYKEDYEAGTTIEAKLHVSNDELFEIGDEGIFFLMTFHDSPKPWVAEVMNPHNAYVGMDFSNEVVTFCAFDSDGEFKGIESKEEMAAQRMAFDSDDTLTFEGIMEIVESYE